MKYKQEFIMECKKLQWLFERTLDERDTARRELCEKCSNVSTPLEYAIDRGWGYLFAKND